MSETALVAHQEQSVVEEKVADRFWAKVDKAPGHGPRGECWVWTAATKTKGYGKFGIGSITALSHRVCWELCRGPIPEGLFVLHRCDNPPCCNPEHLFLGTLADNNRDRDSKGRTNRPIGESNSQAKLTSRDVLAIRALCPSVPRKVLAADFGVSRSVIRDVINKRAWAHI